MKAVIIEKASTAKELKVQEIDIPKVKKDWVLIKIKSFGLNRAEIFTRNGDSPDVEFPRVIGIECVGEVVDPSNSKFHKGDTVISLMGGLGREFNGSYAEYTLIPKEQVYLVKTSLDWVRLASIPEMFYTAYGSLVQSLKLNKEDILLIRGATSSVGIASIQLAKAMGVKVVATTRNKSKIAFLKDLGADYVIIDNQFIKEELFSIFPNGVSKILELVGASTLKDSMKLLESSGILCMSGCLGGWIINEFDPLIDIPSGCYFTTFISTKVNEKLLNELLVFLETNKIETVISKVFSLDDIASAHEYLESNVANGKVIVLNN